VLYAIVTPAPKPQLSIVFEATVEDGRVFFSLPPRAVLVRAASLIAVSARKVLNSLMFIMYVYDYFK
jgi:hypothetical protein